MTPHAFAAWFTGTVLVTRLALWIRPTSSPTVRGFRLHHWMFGAAIAGAVGVVWGHLPLRSMPPAVAALAAVGAGLFADEFTFMLIGVETHAANYSRASLIGTAIIVALVDAALWTIG